MITISQKANNEIEKAKKALSKAINILMDYPEYWDSKSVFHSSIVSDVNKLITANETLNEK